MNTKMTSRIAFSLVLLGTTLHGADVAGSKDHPSLKRVAGSEIFFKKTADFDELKLALSKIEWNGAEAKVKPYQSTTVEGRRLTNYYKVPVGISVLEAYRNYEQELQEKGFEVLFNGRGAEVETPSYNNQIAHEILNMKGIYSTPEEKAQWPFQHTDEEKAAYIAAKKATETGEIYVSVYLVQNGQKDWLGIPVDQTLVRLDVCEVKSREQRMQLVRSEEMASQIALNGRIALYGILFDFNSSAIKPESETTLAEIAKLLSAKPDLKVLVVGHTDTVGSFEFNRKLSTDRAEVVVKHLASNYGIAGRRLFPVGVSFASPVATNTTDEGRAKNRRVELVDMAGGKVE
ncbi:MAG: OmpA family protein [Roseimicrobium sp.]